MAPDTSTATDADAQAALADIERLGGQLRAARTSIGKVIYGQQDVIDQTLVALLSGGHLLPIGESVVDAILKLVRAGRPEHTDLDVVRQRGAWGPGPRASQAFMLACRARAIIQGRLAPSVDDVVALAGPILRHRMAVNFSARAEGVTVESVIAQMCARLG